jgi:hypothetical protein
MSGNIAFNPGITTNAAGSFNVSSQGYIQGTAMPDPSARNALAGGVLAAGQTIPLWGGVGISESIPSSPQTAGGTLGGSLIRAPALTGASALTGFSVFDQNHSAINTPQSPVPLVAVGMGAMFYRLGSGARIAVAADPVLASLTDDIITTQVSWDFDQQRLIPYSAAYAANALATPYASWTAGVVTFTTTTNHGVPVGGVFTISGVTPSAYNGTYTAITGTATTSLVAVKLADPGAYVSGGTLVAGGGALNVRVLDIQVGNSMVVSYDPATGFATWDRSGTAALILI